MDAFNLKKDNRKKFQDKQKLKRRHATQSDLKYRKINKEVEEAKEEDKDEDIPPPLPSNDDRYTGDVLYIPPEQDTQLQAESLQANKIIRQKLSENQSNSLEDSLKSLQIKDPLTSLKGKDILALDINSLNKMIGREASTNKEEISQKKPARPVIAALSQETRTDNKPTVPGMGFKEDQLPNVSKVPTELKDDEDFLDGLL